MTSQKRRLSITESDSDTGDRPCKRHLDSIVENSDDDVLIACDTDTDEYQLIKKIEANLNLESNFDRELNPHGKTIQYRCVFDGKFTSPEFQAPAHKINRCDDLLELITHEIPQLQLSSGFDERYEKPPISLNFPIMLAQECGQSGENFKNAQWTAIYLGHGSTKWTNWYERNILSRKTQNTKTMLLEIHFYPSLDGAWNDQDVLNHFEKLKNGGIGIAEIRRDKLQKMDLSQLANQKSYDAFVRESALAVDEHRALFTEKATSEWFPLRRRIIKGRRHQEKSFDRPVNTGDMVDPVIEDMDKLAVAEADQMVD